MSLSPFQKFTNRVFGTSEHKKNYRFPGAETLKPVFISKLISGFRMLGFRDMPRWEDLHLGFLGDETLKPVFIFKLILGFLLSGFYVIKRQGVHALRHSGSRNTGVSDLCALGHLGTSQVGISGLASTREYTLEYSNL
jgi:hypothetical protein